ncbi:MAG: homoserine O-succinyltransferase [Synergistaceae bacterium]|jgi:homoserine O-succinyltransferase|nr:homoserine O-succinyltransferase [Synergistaceae bacterium]
MPIKIPNDLPAVKTLVQENIYVMTEFRALHQDIRPLRIAILNLMPTKSETELQLLRLLGGASLQIEVDFIQVASHTSKNTPVSHLTTFYKKFDDIRDSCYDGLIITGAPVETLPFEEVDYWRELCEIMEWSKYNVYSCLHICWGAQAGLYYHYGIEKYNMDEKLSGIFAHRNLNPNHQIMRGFDDIYYAPHSRYTTVRIEDILKKREIRLLSTSDAAGAYLVSSADCRKIFITGHPEYDRQTLAAEYARDVGKGIKAPIPVGYFPKDDPENTPVMSWRSHANLLYCNWINLVIYQNTPFDLHSLSTMSMRPQMAVM